MTMSLYYANSQCILCELWPHLHIERSQAGSNSVKNSLLGHACLLIKKTVICQGKACAICIVWGVRQVALWKPVLCCFMTGWVRLLYFSNALKKCCHFERLSTLYATVNKLVPWPFFIVTVGICLRCVLLQTIEFNRAV